MVTQQRRDLTRFDKPYDGHTGALVRRDPI
jgi:hypothetical protein